MTGTLTDPHLADLLARVEGVRKDTERLCGGLSAEQIAWKPAPGRWSILECLDHLAVANDFYLPRARASVDIARAQRLERRKPYEPSWKGRWWIKIVDPDGTARFPAPKLFRPDRQPAPDRWRLFLEQQSTLASILRDADGLDLNEARMTHPLNRFLRFSLGDCLTAVILHEQRHVRQAQRVRADEPPHRRPA
jgi:hypothetical protein